MSDRSGKNVIVIACNALHLGFIGTYGNPWIETPHIDRLAAEGIVFDNHFAENVTTIPTRRSWWTGRYGFADPEQGWNPLLHDERILPDLLWNQGIRSALISDVPYLREAGLGFGRGFDDVVWIRGSGYDRWIPPEHGSARGLPVPAPEIGFPVPDADEPDHALWIDRWSQYLRNRAALALHLDPASTNVARSIDAAVDWLRNPARTSQPFLLWLDLFCPHGPWDPPQPYRDMYATLDLNAFRTDEDGDLAEAMLSDEPGPGLDAARVLIDVPPSAVGDLISEVELLRLRVTYAGCVSLLDHQIGRLMHELRGLGRLEDTLIIFTADQGEPLGEHGYVRRFRPWLYEELIHTPLIVRLPGAARGGRRHQALVQTVDILPTLFDALGAKPEESDRVHGHSLLPLIHGSVTRLREYACMGMDVEEFAIRTQNWHLVVPLESGDDDPPRGIELYRKPEDRWDQNNVVEQFPEVADQLELALRRSAEATRRDRIDSLPPLRESARLGGSI